MARFIASCVLLTTLGMSIAVPVLAQDPLEHRVAELERRVQKLRTPVPPVPPVQQHGPSGGVLFLFGAVCALWAQNTNRSAWLWFFLGLFFSIITVIVLLVKNSDDLKRLGRQSEPG